MSNGAPPAGLQKVGAVGTARMYRVRSRPALLVAYRNSNMKRILNHLGGNDGLFNKRFGQADHVLRYRKCRKPFLRSNRIASGALLPDRLRNQKFVVSA
jgi:hypothetical protein